MAQRILDVLGVCPISATLRADDSISPQRVLHQLVVGLLKQGHGRTNRIAAVRYNDIELLSVFFHELETITDLKSHFGMIESFGHKGQILLGQFYDAFIDLHLVHLLDQRMLANLTSYAPVTTTYDEHFLWVWMTAEWKKCDHLLVCELILFRALDDVVQDQGAAKSLSKLENEGNEDQQVVEYRGMKGQLDLTFQPV